MGAMYRLQEMVRPTLIRIYRITAEEADRYFRGSPGWWSDSLATLIVTGGSRLHPDQELGQILTGFSVSIWGKPIKEIPGFADDSFERDAVFEALIKE